MQEVILEFLLGPEGVKTMPLPALAVAGIAQGVSSLIGAFSAGKQKREARRAAAQYERDLARLEANRQEITNPYADMKDLTGMVTNPFANLQVATKASEMQARETDITLASTLDAIRASGGGGATALAQAAGRAKQGVAASIEQQEARNAQLRAQGQQQMEQMQLQSEMRRQQLMGAGELEAMKLQENREMDQLSRASDLLDRSRMQEAAARQAQNQAIGSLIGTAASFGAQALSAPKVSALQGVTKGIASAPTLDIVAGGTNASDLLSRIGR
jgi:hypothetical protein